MESNGHVNISLKGFIVGNEDNTEWQLISFNRFIDYINADEAFFDQGLEYLGASIPFMFLMAFANHPNAAPEMYMEFASKLCSILMRFKQPDALCRKMPMCDYLVRYGADIFPHGCRKYADAYLNYFYSITDQLSRINALLREHPGAAKCFHIGKLLTAHGFIILKMLRSADKKAVDPLLTAFASEVAKFDALNNAIETR